MMARFSLRDYQIDLVDRVWEHLDTAGARVLAQLPTGGGKSPCQAEIVARAIQQGHQVLVCAHRIELVHQLAGTFERHTGITPQLVTAGSRPDWSAPLLVGMNQSLVRRLDRLPSTLSVVLQDEAHHAISKTYRALYRALPDSCALSGWTATPARLDGLPLSDVFGVLECGPGTDWLIDQGYLARFRYMSVDLMNTKGVRRVAGEFNAADLARANNVVELAAGVVDSYLKHARGLQTALFAINVTHSRQLAWSLAEAGINAVHVDGSTPPEERRRAIADFTAKRVQVLCSCDLFSEGLDIPGIEAVLLARPTASLVVHLQQIGRVLRTAPGKALAVIIDVALNWDRHGLPDDRREWTLEGRPKSAGRPLQVEDDGRVVDVPPRSIVEGHAQLEEIHSSEAHIPATSQAKGFNWIELQAERSRQGHSPMWLWHRLREAGPAATLTAWRDLARLLGRRRGWATHQHNCWTLRLDTNGYPEQRAQWEQPEDDFLRPTATPATGATAAPPIVQIPIPITVLPSPQPTLPQVPSALIGTWSQALQRMNNMRGTQMVLEQQGRLTSIDDDRVVVTIRAKWLGTLQLRQEAIGAAFSDVLGRPVVVDFQPLQDHNNVA